MYISEHVPPKNQAMIVLKHIDIVKKKCYLYKMKAIFKLENERITPWPKKRIKQTNNCSQNKSQHRKPTIKQHEHPHPEKIRTISFALEG